MRIHHLAAVAALAASSFTSANLSAGDCESGSCTKTECTKTECTTGECPISAAVATSMKELPQLAFVIGDECTQCEMTATKLASTHGKAVRYAVGKQSFDEKGAAYDALIAQTEGMLASFTTPAKCAKSGMTTVAGESCGCPIEAGKIAARVKAATKNITVAYRVGSEECDCPKASAAMAKKAGVERTFLVGDVETTCPKTARLAYARARYEAAAKAAAELKLASAK